MDNQAKMRKNSSQRCVENFARWLLIIRAYFYHADFTLRSNQNFYTDRRQTELMAATALRGNGEKFDETKKKEKKKRKEREREREKNDK